jgi:hypothetical protein
LQPVIRSIRGYGYGIVHFNYSEDWQKKSWQFYED